MFYCLTMLRIRISDPGCRSDNWFRSIDSVSALFSTVLPVVHDADIPGSMQKKLPLKRNPWVLSALQLSGADVREEDLCREWIPDPFFAGQVYVCRDRIVFYTAAANPTFLRKETDKRAFLEKYISPKKK